MKKHFINALVALGLLAALSSCSKEEQSDLKPVKTMAHPLDPGNYGYYEVVPDENYFYNDSVSTFARPTANYLKMNPLPLEKYKNRSLLDSVCNKDLALHFEAKALKTHPKSALWGAKPYVENEHPPLLTLNSTNRIITIKMSKMVTGFGLELNSYYQELGKTVGINISFWNSKLNKMVEHSAGTRYLRSPSAIGTIPYGEPGGARAKGLNGKEEFDEVRIRFEYNPDQPPTPVGPFEVYVTGFRYVLAK